MTRTLAILISRPGSPINPRAITIGSPSTGSALNAKEAHTSEIGQKEGPGLRAAPALSLALIHLSAWKGNS
jgi:hypothetical protein